MTTAAPGFAMNSDISKYDANDMLLPQYSYVCFNGPVVVRTATNFTSAPANSKCMPNDDGIAVLSNNGVGYRILSVVDSTHACILFEPQMMLLSNIKNNVDEIQKDIENIQLQIKESSSLVVGESAPEENTKLLWIDTTPINGGLKYYNGSEWVHVPVAYAT